MAANYSTQEALHLVMDSSDSEPDFTDLEDLQSSSESDHDMSKL